MGRIRSETVLVRESTESVGTEMDEGFHVVFGEATMGCLRHVVPFHLLVLLHFGLRSSGSPVIVLLRTERCGG